MLPEVLLHAVPIRHGAASDPWLVGGLLVAGVALSVGVGVVAANRGLAAGHHRAAAGLAAGALLFLFFDLLKGSAGLGQGLLGSPLLQLALVAAFLSGILLVPAFSRDGADADAVAFAWACGVAAHSAGEGWIIGTAAFSADVAAPLGTASFLIHKVVEGASIPIVGGLGLRGRPAWLATAVVTVAAATGFAAGLAAGPGTGPTLLFAAGAGATAYAALRLAARATLETRQATWIALGALVVYAAGLLHEI